ncbi:MAG: hypothetical protein A3H69_05105 [Candidatus Sungbacteria bacterium RIFCSPLOWO2_02_FULL_47_9]|uniref:PDZ domain-containing protein n=1 Tax=Candidatus Sungbacteria bacterium RIFCSPHIGHO2_01_FULL_47_32 TaxID=1802264 RepID=A0A1G2K7P8_9BACT|nr:MAG: Membrane-associated zinc metalloprotease [Parcubacteria group bacterium GW2011_GWA2_47_10]OGZ94448.1 MAG: hypothetical protein A2633_04190 [Candidatus Sungbacteria bacterium RIFCSPHIGHO2_01_FULL_47_32]OGZ98040.1 MAG: hypothetical protein A3D57_02895 [Candidatus Sungbacteria bacterium RIFCSPHIGHO2_02_FULL_46_12]OHA05790.1 MAG: hypothetical protein A3A28_05655 [Candidatus Sungbacteria bacterium RIFCSPLOWO2_01_FULL_47_32]OHA10720.1 MAG: hypothetical protein A3H69_05105 [Candidatus Sungbact
MIFSILSFVFLIAILVLVHEWGHFWTARKLKIKVEEFGFGFPPRVGGITKNGILYSLNLLPLGGFVKIFGEGGEGEGNPESFISRPVWQRFVVIGAGVFMNLVLAWVLFSFGAGLGTPSIIDEENAEEAGGAGVTIIGVVPKSPADAGGIQFGDVVTRLENLDTSAAADVKKVQELQDFIANNAGHKIKMGIKRGSAVVEVTAVPRVNPPEGEGSLGISIALVGIVRAPWYTAPWEGAKRVVISLENIVSGFYSLFKDLFASGKVSVDVSGPVGIFVVAGQAGQLGFAYFLNLIAVLSVNLAFLNAMPIPALDGGRILFLAIEKVRGVKVNQRIEQMVHTIGFVVLILLMLAITYRDLTRFL